MQGNRCQGQRAQQGDSQPDQNTECFRHELLGYCGESAAKVQSAREIRSGASAPLGCTERGIDCRRDVGHRVACGASPTARSAVPRGSAAESTRLQFTHHAGFNDNLLCSDASDYSRSVSIEEQAMKVGILTGGGDCPGLNAVIRAVVRKGSFPLRRRICGISRRLARPGGRQNHAARSLQRGGHLAPRRHHPAHFAHQPRQRKPTGWKSAWPR